MLDLAQLKQHLNVEHDEDDNLITLYYNAAVISAQGFLDAEIVDSGATEGQINMNDAIKVALYVVVADAYENRGNNSKDMDYHINRQVHQMLFNLRKF